MSHKADVIVAGLGAGRQGVAQAAGTCRSVRRVCVTGPGGSLAGR